ncbi:SDR family oxidoreductase [Candidatus Uabimicrobium amorphum]|uniref:Short-chain dehydrogenase n=1 Tax=Uabimicrobium amorphum TaxID=2596890 RepID=A0A5S9IN97_UABAM|nr:SDR family oxidoreductase [Candidatus Uabimicrobium amorphum]BBM83685.1 short-chain dehydrogenase [Candidatus Uabimicrobium amorphum]
MNISLTNKQAIICGASQGIGRATAIQFANLGASTLLLARNEEKLQEIIRDLPQKDAQQHHYLVVDLSQPQQTLECVNKFLKDKPIHILVNNCGGPKPGSLIDAHLDDFDNAFTPHLKASHLLVQSLHKRMAAENYGRVINIISTSVKQPIRGLGVSNTTRGAMASWAKTLAAELGPLNITVNNVLPGYTATERLQSIIANKATKNNSSTDEVTATMKKQVPLGRFATATEVANAIAFLASPAASYINGISLAVDGGRTESL